MFVRTHLCSAKTRGAEGFGSGLAEDAKVDSKFIWIVEENKILLHLSEGDDFFFSLLIPLFCLLPFWRGISRYTMANTGSFLNDTG